MADASKALGAPEIAGAWIERKGFAKKGMNAIASAEIGGMLGTAVGTGLSGKGTPKTAETPSFGAYGYLALSANDLVLVRAKQGLTGMKLTDDVIASVPRSAVGSAELGQGKVSSPFTITFSDGGTWELEVARARRRGAERVIAELGG